MSHTWICAKCGASAYSKCPDARNVFEDDITIQHIRSLLATHVIPTSNGVEVFLNLTVYADNENPLAYAFNFLQEHMDKIRCISCDHWWFIKHDSTEPQICTCDHHHPTTASESFKEAQLAATKEGEHEKVYDYKGMQQNYARYLGYVLDQLSQKCRIEKYQDGEAQSKVSDDIEYIKGQLRLLLTALYKESPVKPAIHMHQRGIKWNDPDVFHLTCTTEEVGKEILAILQDKMFPDLRAYDQKDQRVEAAMIPVYCKCAHCGIEVEGKSVIENKKLYHQKCHNRLHKITTKHFLLRLDSMTKDQADRLSHTWRSFGPDYDYDKVYAEMYTENMRQMLGSVAWNVELLKFQYSEPHVWEMDKGKTRKHNGGIYVQLRGLTSDIEAVFARLQTLNKKETKS